MSSGAKAKSYGPLALVQCSEESCLEKLFNKTGMERKQLCLRGLWTRVLPILKKILWQKQKNMPFNRFRKFPNILPT